jgi:hypothetical protein
MVFVSRVIMSPCYLKNKENNMFYIVDRLNPSMFKDPNINIDIYKIEEDEIYQAVFDEKEIGNYLTNDEKEIKRYLMRTGIIDLPNPSKERLIGKVEKGDHILIINVRLGDIDSFLIFLQ